jgi:glyoxylase-like metal-dependent hydrolase (beta-lactamase superfamily II)
MKKKFHVSLIVVLFLFTIILSPIPFAEAKSKGGSWKKYAENIEVTPVSEDVWRFEETIYVNDLYQTVSGHYKVNVYVIELEGSLVLIDAGVESYAKTLHKLIKKQFKGKKIEAVFLTHAHADHAGGGGYFIEKGINVYAHLNDWPLIQIGMNIPMDSSIEIDPQFTYTGYSPSNDYSSMRTPTRDFSNILLIDTPGHTEGSVSISYIEEDEDVLLFTGDTLFPSPDSYFSMSYPYYLGFPDNPIVPDDLTFLISFFTAAFYLSPDSRIHQRNSVINLQDFADTSMTICPGHQEPTTNHSIFETTLTIMYVALWVPEP